MRRVVFLLLAIAMLSLTAVGNAFSGDLAAPQYHHYQPPPPPPPVFNWTGFYAGGFIGGALSNQNVTATDLNGFNFAGNSWDYGIDNSVIGGGTLGYNWQYPGSPFLVGIEGEVGYMHLTGSAADPVDSNTISSARMGDWYGVLAGRLGWLVTPEWLFYAKGGAAWTDLNADVTAPGLIATGSHTTTGWTLGGGAEWMFAPQWSVKAEYLLLGFDDNVAACDTGANFCWNHNFNDVHILKAGLNYHF